MSRYIYQPDMGRPVRFGIVGSNIIVDKLLDASKAVPGFVLAAVYSRTAERAAEFATKHGCSVTFTSLEEMARSDAVDAVYIASPTSEHAWQAIVFLKRGKHVLCEKPACSTPEELDAVLAAAREGGAAFMEAMRPVRTPNYARAREVVAGLGPVRHFAGSFCQLSSRWPAFLSGERPNAFLPQFSNGALMDIGVYAVYSVVGLLGPPQAVKYTPVMLPTGVDGAGTLVMQYPDGVATLVISKMSHGFAFSEVQTDKGTVQVDNLGEWADLRLQRKGGKAEAIGVAQAPNNMEYELRAFVETIRDGRQQDAVLTWELARQVAAVLREARRSAGIVFPADRKPKL